MTPKEKAKSLVEKHFVTVLASFENKGYNLNMDDVEKAATQCALVSVNEIIFLHSTGDVKENFGKYFIEVKQEIEKLK